MLKKLTVYFVLILFVTSLTGCAAFKRFQSRKGTKEEAPSGSLQVASVLRFSDVPVPSGFGIRAEDSYSFQTKSFRAGLLRYRGSANPESVVSFYKNKMPQHNWELVNLIEYNKRLLNFEKQNQSCIITIEGGMTRTTLTISVSPKSESTTSVGSTQSSMAK